MHQSLRSPKILLNVALSVFILSACASDVGDEASERGPDPQQMTSRPVTPPPDAHLLDADSSLTVEAALERLRFAGTQKLQNGLYCDTTPRVIEARSAGNLVTVETGWPEPDKGILRGSAPWAQYGTVREGFWICSIGEHYALYSMGANRFVSAELDWDGEWNATLRARATYVDIWERFYIAADSTPDPTSFTIRSMANNRLVSAEFAYSGTGYGTLRARATAEDSWERFRIR